MSWDEFGKHPHPTGVGCLNKLEEEAKQKSMKVKTAMEDAAVDGGDASNKDSATPPDDASLKKLGQSNKK